MAIVVAVPAAAAPPFLGACTPVGRVPTTIAAPGVYCLTGNLATSIAAGNAVTIAADDVVLDLGGFTLDGSGAGDGTLAAGIRADSRKNITIRGGTVRGFSIGVHLADSGLTSQGHVIERVRADRNTYAGLVAGGRGNLVRQNQVIATGGASVGSGDAYGIVVGGAETRVVDNDVVQTTAAGAGEAAGLYLESGSDHLVVGNRITDAPIGILFILTSAKYRGNLTSGVATPFEVRLGAVVDAGGNH